MTDSITLQEAISVRKLAGYSQETMAEAIGLSKSAWAAIETEKAEFRLIHALAVERIALRFAIIRARPGIAPPPLARDIREFVNMVRETDFFRND